MSGANVSDTGSVADMVSRIRAVLPPSWFPVTPPGTMTSVSPVLDALLAGIGQGWSYCYALTQFVISQARAATATGGFLDMLCADFFGSTVVRQAGETDDLLRSRIRASLLPLRATRMAVSSTIETLVGLSPIVLEPWRAADTGGYAGSTNTMAGGGGGYGSPGLVYGSAAMPFQYLVTVPEDACWSRRESVGSYIDQTGAMQLAPRHVARPTFTNGVQADPLVEGRGFNLIKDSIGWTGWASSGVTADARWQIDPSGAGAILAGQPVLRIGIYSGGGFSGPAIAVSIGDQAATGSAWLMLAAGHLLTSISLTATSDAGDTPVSAGFDVSVSGKWQRVAVTLPAAGPAGRVMTLTLTGQSSGIMESPILTQCWQIEPGDVATSYIPSSYQIGIREADQIVQMEGSVRGGIDPTSLNATIRRVIPAGSIAWTSALG